MDTDLSADFKRRALVKKWVIAGIFVVALITMFFGFRNLIQPSIERSEFQNEL